MTAITDKTLLGGIYPAALTMFDGAGKLDLDASAKHVRSLVDQGAHGIVVAGTTGEFVAMTGAERTALITAIVDTVGGAVPVVAGTGSFATAETVELTTAAAEAGADAALVILPYYQRPHRDEVVEHYRAVARAVDVPVWLYNNPTNSGTDALDASDVGMLAREGVLHGVKSTFPTVHQVHEVRAEVPDDFRVFYGSFMAPLEGLAGGASGWISGILNVVLPDALDLWNAMAAQDLTKARAAWARILPVKYLWTRRPLGPASDLEIYRAILRLRGAHGGHSRRPLLPLTDEQVARLGRLVS